MEELREARKLSPDAIAGLLISHKVRERPATRKKDEECGTLNGTGGILNSSNERPSEQSEGTPFEIL